jgi:hypothetical protein
MKTTILIAMLLVGNAFAQHYDFAAADAALRDPKNIGNNCPAVQRPQMPDVVAEAKKRMENQAPYVPTPDNPSSRSSSTSYSIITLPDGQTASVLTFK